MIRTSLPAPRRIALAAAVVLFPFHAGCGSERRTAPAPDPALHRVHVGLDQSGPADAALGYVVAARVTDGARHVVVLDFVPPFVKVFDADGRFETAFLRKGGGPGEARAPVALAVAGDSLVLVADGTQSVSLFDLGGRLRAQARVPGLIALAASPGCGGEWLLYGPRMDPARGAGAALWLHRVRFTGPDRVEIRSLLDDAVPGRLPSGLPYGMVADADGAVLRHSLGRRPQVLRLSCADGSLRVLHEGAEAEAEPAPAAGARTVRMTVAPGTRAPGGVAVLKGTVVFGERVFGSGRESRLDLTFLGAGGERTVSIEGDYALRDSRPDAGVLVSTSHPVPQVFLIRPADFMGLFPAP